MAEIRKLEKGSEGDYNWMLHCSLDQEDAADVIKFSLETNQLRHNIYWPKGDTP